MVNADAVNEMIQNWANHTASIFSGNPRSDIEDQLSQSFVNSILIGASVIPEIADIVVGFSWDENNKITAVVNPVESEDTLVIRGSECLQLG